MFFGQEHIEQGAMHQMYTAAKLPVAIAGALMPDAHVGYGLPIGGVLATENAVIPYGVVLILVAECVYPFSTLIQKN
jgi:tRNA-splicing ligase RtcB